MKKVKWGILSTAKIGREKVIPAMLQAKHVEVVAIASRDIEAAKNEAGRLGIPRAYGSYEALLSDPGVEAVYIPLPNHLHVEWAIKSLQAGKHVLCEKPIGLSSQQAGQLAAAAAEHPRLKIMEAFMYRFHPQWQYARKMMREGTLGEVKAVQSFFSYYNTDPKNIRNIKEVGGGAMMDIGCYCISIARFLFEKEPVRVSGTVVTDEKLGTDILSSGILDFSTGNSTFTCSTQSFPYQRVNIAGTEGRLEIMIPFNAPPAEGMEMWHHSKNGPGRILFEATDQYTLQADAFSLAVLDNTEVPYPLGDAVNNMRVIEAVFKSAAEGKWIE